MKKKYLTPIMIILLLIVFQEIRSQQVTNEKKTDSIEGLSIYPNPAIGDKIYVTSSLGLTKQIKIYDVLGKKIFFKVLVGQELDIASLNSGVYYMEVSEYKSKESIKFIVNKRSL